MKRAADEEGKKADEEADGDTAGGIAAAGIDTALCDETLRSRLN